MLFEDDDLGFGLGSRWSTELHPVLNLRRSRKGYLDCTSSRFTLLAHTPLLLIDALIGRESRPATSMYGPGGPVSCFYCRKKYWSLEIGTVS